MKKIIASIIMTMTLTNSITFFSINEVQSHTNINIFLEIRDDDLVDPSPLLNIYK